MKRILFNLLFFVLLITLPWWILIALGLILVFYFRNYFEIVIWALIYDILFAQISNTFNVLDYKFTLGAIVLFFISLFLQKRLKFYIK